MPSYTVRPGRKPYDPERAREDYIRRKGRNGKYHRVYRNQPRRSQEEIAAEQMARAQRAEDMREKARNKVFGKRGFDPPDMKERLAKLDAAVELARKFSEN